MRASLDGTVLRYVYNGNRVLEETSDVGSVLARHTTSDSSYYGPWLHMWRSEDVDRFPLFDAVGSARGLVDSSAAVSDSYVLDSFGTPTGAATATVNPYRFGGAWGYITDTPGSGLLQLGARYYWPELGRFIQQDPIGDGMNWYAYVGNNPLRRIDPAGRAYTDLNITVGIVTFGIQYGDDPCAHGKPWSPWHASAWRNWHPYAGPALGAGASLQYAPDILDPVSGNVYKQTPSSGWYRQIAVGVPIGNPYVGISGAIGNKLNPSVPWYQGIWNRSGNLPWFGEIGIGTTGLSISAPYVW